MTFIILFLIFGLNNLLISQPVCFNLDFVNKSWYKKDSIVSVENIPNKFEVIINEKVIQNIKLDSDIIDLKIYDILGKNIPFEFSRNQRKLNITINDDSIKNNMILITFIVIKNGGINYISTKKIIE